MVDFLLQNVPKRPRKSGPVYTIKSCKSKSGLNFSIRPKHDDLRSIYAKTQHANKRDTSVGKSYASVIPPSPPPTVRPYVEGGF